MKTVSKVEFLPKLKSKNKKVAAYARVSVDSERLMHSLAAQVSYYSTFIQAHPGWEFAGVFSDSGLSGTTSDRQGLKDLLKACDEGLVDIVLVKSISRFARNTLDLLNILRDLKDKGIEVIFEKEGINSMTEDGELMLTLLASFAQEESKSISDNIKWRIRKDYEKGIVKKLPVYGYLWNGDKVELHPYQAPIVRRVFDLYIAGKSINQIATLMAEEGHITNRGCLFSASTVTNILNQERYTGKVTLQKTFVESHLTHKHVKNTGQLPKYIISDFCPAIVSEEEFQAVQRIKKQRSEVPLSSYTKQYHKRPYKERVAKLVHKHQSYLSGKIICSDCGKFLYKIISKNTCGYWVCPTKDKGHSHQYPEALFEEAICKVLGIKKVDPDKFNAAVEHIIVEDYDFTFCMKDQSQVTFNSHPLRKEDRWDEKRRSEWKAYRRSREGAVQLFSSFTCLVRCPECGKNFISRHVKYKSGLELDILRCQHESLCNGRYESIKLENFKAIVCDVLGLETFDEQTCLEKISYAEADNQKILFHLKDGSLEERPLPLTNKRLRVQTPQQRAHRSQVMAEIWRKRHEQHNSNSGNDDTVCTCKQSEC